MSSLFPFTVRRVEWRDACNELRAVRKLVFIDEQKVPVDLEWDDLDQVSAHVLAQSSEGESIGTGRLLPDGHIGRMAVVQRWRGRGVGSGFLGGSPERPDARAGILCEPRIPGGRPHLSGCWYRAPSHALCFTCDL